MRVEDVRLCEGGLLEGLLKVRRWLAGPLWGAAADDLGALSQVRLCLRARNEG